MNRREFLHQLPRLFAVAAVSPVGRLFADSLSERSVFNIRRFGAKGNGSASDTKSIQKAIDAAGREGGCVYFPPGRYLSGTLHLRSHVTVQLENGATLSALPARGDFDDYEKLSYNSYSDKETTDFNYGLLCGRDVENIAILGPGRIDMAHTERGGPKPIALKLCKQILIRDLTIENAPNYNISLLGCDFVDILGVTIRNGYADGIDPDCCRHVRIANCFVEAWDDAIVPKSSPSLGYLRASEFITATNCVLTTCCNGLKLGTESSGGFKDIAFSNCTIFSNPERWGKHRATSGLSIETVDGGAIERITVSNLTMRDVRAPVYVRLGNRGRSQKAPQPEHLSDISISDIVATGADLASSITGIPHFPVQGITLKNLRASYLGGGKADVATKEIPEHEKDYPDAKRLGDLPAYGLYCRHVQNLSLDQIHLGYGAFDERPAVVFDDVSGADLRSIMAMPPQSEQPVVSFQNGRDCFIQGCRALFGTRTWAGITGEKTAHIHAIANDFSAASKPVQLGAEVPADAVKFEL